VLINNEGPVRSQLPPPSTSIILLTPYPLVISITATITTATTLVILLSIALSTKLRAQSISNLLAACYPHCRLCAFPAQSATSPNAVRPHPQTLQNNARSSVYAHHGRIHATISTSRITVLYTHTSLVRCTIRQLSLGFIIPLPPYLAFGLAN
jgi:hypothetical protein